MGVGLAVVRRVRVVAAGIVSATALCVISASSHAGLSAGDEEQAERISALLSRFSAPDGFALSIGVVRDGGLLYRGDFGLAHREHRVPIGPESVFSLASLSKQFTAFSILLLARQGKLSQDDDVRAYLPELPVYHPERPMTVEHLLHHTSGLRDHLTLAELVGARMNEDYLSVDEQYQLITRQRELCFPTGERYMYSNTAYLLLAIIVERVSGQSFKDYLQTKVLEPLGMSHTVVVDDTHAMIPNRVQGCALGAEGHYRVLENTFPNFGYAGVWSTLDDLVRWDANFYDPTVGDAWVIEQMTRPGKTDDGDEVGYGGGLRLREYRGLRLHEHAGGEEGFRSQFWRFPDQRLSIITLGSGGRDMARLIDPIIPQIVDLLLTGQFQDPPDDPDAEPPVADRDDPGARGRVEVAPEELEWLAGRYSRPDPGDVFEFRIEGRALQCSYYRPGETTAKSTIEVFSTGDRRFTRETSDGESFRFEAADHRFCRYVDLELPGVDPPLRFSRLEPLTDVQTIPGEYYSADLGISWELTVDGDLLRILLPNRARKELFDEPHKYVGNDTFVAPLQHDPLLRLKRDASGAVIGFSWDGYNLIKLDFKRRSGA